MGRISHHTGAVRDMLQNGINVSEMGTCHFNISAAGINCVCEKNMACFSPLMADTLHALPAPGMIKWLGQLLYLDWAFVCT